MHDNIFDKFLEYLNSKKMLGGSQIGQFVSIQDDFYIFDIDFYKKLSRENGFIDKMSSPVLHSRVYAHALTPAQSTFFSVTSFFVLVHWATSH